MFGVLKKKKGDKKSEEIKCDDGYRCDGINNTQLKNDFDIKKFVFENCVEGERKHDNGHLRSYRTKTKFSKQRENNIEKKATSNHREKT